MRKITQYTENCGDWNDDPMLNDFNLLITTRRGNEVQVCSEVWYLLGEAGDDAPVVDKTGISGLVTARTSLSPFIAIDRLRTILSEQPSEFRYTLRVIPIQKVVKSNVSLIKEAARDVLVRIKEGETFRITIEKRHTSISRRELVKEVASIVEKRVNLTNPDKIIAIEIVGKFTGISALNPSEIISTSKERKC
jgi:tRNA acetyltransferase TAN1